MTENRLKFRVYDIRRKVYFNDPVPPLNSDGTLAFQSSHPDFQKYYITEFCTGLKDKNGNLIYEGDLLTDGRDTGHVLWRGSGWGCTAFLWKKEPETLEICGNIHEQAEQKDVK